MQGKPVALLPAIENLADEDQISIRDVDRSCGVVGRVNSWKESSSRELVEVLVTFMRRVDSSAAPASMI
jgi:hypothetical protein